MGLIFLELLGIFNFYLKYFRGIGLIKNILLFLEN